MPRPIWTGAISFGLVNVPVKLFTATESKDVSFHQLQRETGERIRYRRVAEGTGEEVPYEDIVKGYDIDGRHVVVEPDELEALQPEKSRTIEIEEFVDLDDVDPIYFQKTYFVVPAGPEAAKPYGILRQAMTETNRAGVATFVMRGKEHLAAVRPMDGVLALETMFFADEVRDAGAIDELDALEADDVSDRERNMAVQLVESLTEEWDPTRHRDTYREQVLDLIERKGEGEAVVAEAPAAEPEAKVIDLMAALEASVEEARQGRPTSPRSGGGDGDEPLGARSKEELYEEAQRQDIPGRSKMTKEELADALRRAS